MTASDEIRYDYHDSRGRVCYTVIRHGDGPGKSFQVVDRQGEELPNPLPHEQRVLYRLLDLLTAPRTETVYIAEGEKDVEALRGVGLLATTMPFGTRGGWLASYSNELLGRHVVILPDGDRVGQRHAKEVREALEPLAASVVVVSVGERWSSDAAEWLSQRGNSAEKLRMLVDRQRCMQAGLTREARTKSDRIHLVRRASISTLAKLLLLLATEERHQDNRLPNRTIAELAEECGCHRVTLQKTIAELGQMGVLERGGGRSLRLINWGIVAMRCPPSKEASPAGSVSANS